jgi:hypothetical protein
MQTSGEGDPVTTVDARTRETAWTRWPRRTAALVVLAVRFELGMWRSLARWIFRRPDVRPDEAPFAYRSQLVAPVLAFFVVSLVEVVALDVLVPWGGWWEALRLPLLIVGVWGTLLILSVLAALTVHPHVVGLDGIRVRSGTSVDVRLPWDAVTGARHVTGGRDGRTVQVDGETLYVQVSKQTNVEVTLDRPVTVPLPRGRTAEVTAVRLLADDATALVAAVGRQLHDD